MIQYIKMSDGFQHKTTRCPMRFDGQILTSEKGCPILGEDYTTILALAKN